MGEICSKCGNKGNEDNIVERTSHIQYQNYQLNGINKEFQTFNVFSIIVSTYNSQYDIVFSEIEKKYNVICTYDLIEFLNNLKEFDSIDYKWDSAPSSEIFTFTNDIHLSYENIKIKLKSEELSMQKFNLFLNEKIFPNISNRHRRRNEISTFEDIIKYLYLQIYIELNNLTRTRNGNAPFYEESENIEINEDSKNVKIPKLYTLAIAYSLCTYQIKNKIILINKLFSNQIGELENSGEFFYFVYLIIALATYSSLNAIKSSSENNIALTKIKKKDYLYLLSVYNHEKIFECTQNFIKNLFVKERRINEEILCERLKTKECNWILCNSGIRYILENSFKNK